MAKWKNKYPYLYMSVEELHAIDNDTLVRLVKEWFNTDCSPDSSYYLQGNRLAAEKQRRIFAGLLDVEPRKK